MARSKEEIRAIIKAKAREFPSLNGLLFADDAGATLGSQFIALTEGVVSGQQSLESIADALQVILQALAAAAPSGNPAWIQAQIFKFQFGDEVQIDENFVVFYPVVDPAKQIITRCSVFVEAGTSIVQIKVAKSEPPEPLAAGELTALQDYYFGSPQGDKQGVGFAGVRSTFVNLLPDRLYVEGVVRYDGEFDPAQVKAAVIAAIENFIATTFTQDNFNGTIKMQLLTGIILGVAGVSRFEYAVNGIRARPETTAFPDATVVSQDGSYNAVSGYMISEDTTGETLNDKITTQLEGAS